MFKILLQLLVLLLLQSAIDSGIAMQQQPRLPPLLLS